MSPKPYKIDGGYVDSDRRIEPESNCLTPPSKLSFGFKFFREIDGFGLKAKGKSISNKWMLSFIEKLGTLGQFSKDDFDSDRQLAAAHRYHRIDWSAHSIPVSRDDFAQLPQVYRNDEDYPFWQFQLSKATGRFFGFYDENDVFQIVGVDPLHNLQPAGGRFAYKVDSCSPLGTELDGVLAFLEQVHSKCKVANCCQHRTDFERIFSGKEVIDRPILAFHLREEQYDDFISLREQFLCRELPVEPVDVFAKGIEAYRGELQDE